MSVDKWDSRKIVKRTQAHIAKNMDGAMLILQGDVQRKLSVGQPVVRSGKSLRGLNPSKEGEPPHLLTSRLRASITHSVESDPLGDIVGRVGTNVPYARRLELGFSGTDSLGRNINQGARPYLVPALKENLPRLIARLTRA